MERLALFGLSFVYIAGRRRNIIKENVKYKKIKTEKITIQKLNAESVTRESITRESITRESITRGSVMRQEYIKFAAKWKKEYLTLLKTLISIPSPSYQEREIAVVIKEFLEREAEKNHYQKVHIFMDDIWNVYCEIGGPFHPDTECELFCAHTDTVFPDDKKPIPVQEEKARLYGLGAKDNCANVCALMFCAKYIFENYVDINKNLLLVFDVCEEGAGNLLGCKKIFEKYFRIKQMTAFDLDYRILFHRAVGSARYDIGIKVQGGHAFHDFGNKNAIQIMSEIIQKFYEIDISVMDGSSSYNVGKIEGGTSVNVIAQECHALFEWRSDSEQTLQAIGALFEKILKEEEEKAQGRARVEKRLIGLRPSTKVFTEEENRLQSGLTERTRHIIEEVTGQSPCLISGSTDCNIPLSKGIPAVCTGTCLGGGEHTRQEYVEISSLEQGLVLALEIMCGSLTETV